MTLPDVTFYIQAIKAEAATDLVGDSTQPVRVTAVSAAPSGNCAAASVLLSELVN